jgi:hypothetical protein
LEQHVAVIPGRHTRRLCRLPRRWRGARRSTARVTCTSEDGGADVPVEGYQGMACDGAVR